MGLVRGLDTRAHVAVIASEALDDRLWVRGASLVGAAEWMSLGGALAHVWEVPEHWRQWWGYGAFFIAVAGVQGTYSVLLPRLARHLWFLLTGVVGTLALLGVWLQSRLYHPPLGPHRLHREEFRTADLLSAGLEVAVVVLLVAAAARGQRQAASRRRRVLAQSGHASGSASCS